uniref:WLM domain-containing protein n=1 Tax=viral metagenome TaxID=1070528 RepID=A0A6C0E2A5_9ZZZZ
MFNYKKGIFFYIILGFILFICLKIYYESDAFNLKCIISNVDGNTYCVRERAKLELASDLLARVTKKCKDLVDYVAKKYPNDEDVMRLKQNFNPKTISETLPTSEHTAYSENKGEKIAFCLNTTKEGNKLIDLSTLTFVAIHELSHVMTKSEGHKQVFWQNFKFLLENAKEANIYQPVDYKKEPKEYCGMKITDSPYYDLK